MASITTIERELLSHLRFIYGDERADAVLNQLKPVLRSYQNLPRPAHASPLDARDSILIAYADQIYEEGENPLSTLEAFLSNRLNGLFRGVHILPFFPFSSDDGFSIIDYRKVNPDFGSWGEIEVISSRFRLMIDAVINHISRESEWFQRFLEDETPYAQYFISVETGMDLSSVVRPRDLPLLTSVETKSGTRQVWTTFSEDQIDLNFANPDVLVEVIDLLMFYIAHGAQLIRLDAVAFLWKEIGTSCIHHPRTHRIINLIRTIIDTFAPWVYIVTETNVPHEENISYFGNGWNEAQLVYQFALPPLVLHTLLSGNARALNEWASSLQTPSSGTTFFNFLASHDGIGLRPARGILNSLEIQALVQQCEARGGGVSYRALNDGMRDPYELNITYFDALAFDGEEDGNLTWISRYLNSQAIMLALAGIPGIYFHSLLGSRNAHAAVDRTGRLRSINRERLNAGALEKELDSPETRRARVFTGYASLLRNRAEQPAFNPNSSQQILDLGPDLFCLLRTAPDGDQLLCLNEVAGKKHLRSISLSTLPASSGRDILSKEYVSLSECSFEPYQVRWIKLLSP
ncbi:MAG: sugar phosphorylase [Anaerolineales bacterium]|nr:sugar phosphorylase [Anaerolineales bacterium]